MRKIILCLVTVLTVGSLAHAQGPSSDTAERRAEVLVLGTYHMSNPGRDIFNVEADDVLVPKRQREIAEVVAVLKRFQPTKIAVETTAQDKLDKRYSGYLAGKYNLTASETDQIGLRLAKDLGHEAVYAVDADGDFPFESLMEYVKANGRSDEFGAMLAEIEDTVKFLTRFQNSHTVLQTLLYLNADAQVAADVGYYYRQAHYGETGDYAGPDLVTEWFRRNIHIYNNIVRLVDSPDDRVLVIFGSGHLGWLRQNFEADPTIRLRKLQEFVSGHDLGE